MAGLMAADGALDGQQDRCRRLAGPSGERHTQPGSPEQGPGHAAAGAVLGASAAIAGGAVRRLARPRALLIDPRRVGANAGHPARL